MAAKKAPAKKSAPAKKPAARKPRDTGAPDEYALPIRKSAAGLRMKEEADKAESKARKAPGSKVEKHLYGKNAYRLTILKAKGEYKKPKK